MIRAGIPGMAGRLGRFLRGERGAGSVELVIALPLVMALFMMAAESGLYMTRDIMLERAVDMTIRDLRLGVYDNPDHQLLRREICRRATTISNCENAIRIELRPVSTTTWNLPTDRTACQDRDEPITEPTLNPGAQNELMLVRVCLIQDAMFPGMQFSRDIADPNDSAGGYALISVNAFVNEPS